MGLKISLKKWCMTHLYSSKLSGNIGWNATAVTKKLQNLKTVMLRFCENAPLKMWNVAFLLEILKQFSQVQKGV